MKKEQLLDRLEEAWAAFNRAYAGLTPEQMTRPGVTGDWSVKDLLSHVTIWEQEALKYLPQILEGKQPPRYSALYGGIDAFNAQSVGKRQDLPLEAVLRELDETHNRLVEYVRLAPEEQFATDTRFRRRLRLDTYSHYPHHTRAILEWRENSGDHSNTA